MSTKKNSIEKSISDLFAHQLMNVVAGLESAFLVDLDTGEIVVSYPEKESENDGFIAEICGTTTIQFEQQAKSTKNQGSELSLTSMEIRTTVQEQASKRISTYRITPTWVIVLLGREDTFRPAFAKRLCEGPIKDDIESLLVQYNIAE